MAEQSYARQVCPRPVFRFRRETLTPSTGYGTTATSKPALSPSHCRPGGYSYYSHRRSHHFCVPVPLHPRRRCAHDHLQNQPVPRSQVHHVRHVVRVLYGSDGHLDHANSLGLSTQERADRNCGASLRCGWRGAAFRH